MTQTIKIRNEPAQHIGVANSAPCPEMNIVTKEITENGRYEARAEGATGFDPVIVNVPGEEIADGFIDGTISGDYRNVRITAIRKYGISYCDNLTSVDLPNATRLGQYAIINNNNLKSINLPSVVNISSNAMQYNKALQSVSLPKATSVGVSAFDGCESLTEAYVPALASLSTSSFSGCIKLVTIDLPSASSMSAVFGNCHSLTTVILRRNSVCKLTSTTCFFNCYHILGTVNATYNPEGLKDGFIFVPDNLLEDYRQATNWSAFADQIKPISELEE